jgi:hypothetical protein
LSCTNGKCVPLTPDPTPTPTPNKCSDGAALNSCSTNKPMYCNLQGTLVNNCAQCGCGNGEICDGNSCKKVEQIIVNQTNPCTKVTFSKWSQCSKGVQTRTIQKTEPASCTLTFKLLLSRDCLVSKPIIDRDESEVIVIETPPLVTNPNDGLVIGIIIGGATLLIMGNTLLIIRAIKRARTKL